MRVDGTGRQAFLVGSLSDFSALKFSDFPSPAGSWFMLLDSDTKIPGDRVDHPWMLDIDFQPRLSFAHACLRSRSHPRPWDVYLDHPAHPVGHDEGCLLDSAARVNISSRRPMRPEWLDHGRFSCIEPDPRFVSRVQEAIGEAST